MDDRTASACPTEAELIEYVDGALARERAAFVERHVDACIDCRRLVAELVREPSRALPSTATRPLPAAQLPSSDAVPVGLVREYMRADAVHRESIVARTIAALAAFSIAVTLLYAPVRGPDGFVEMLAILLVALAYSTSVALALRRGWFHRALPFVASVVEVWLMFGLQFVIVTTNGPESAMASPAAPLAAALVVFSAIRGDPRVCLVAGVAAMLGFVAMHEAAHLVLPAQLDGPPPGVSFVAGAFYLVAGCGGAVLARYLVARAEFALRAIREQDMFGKYMLHEALGTGGMGEVFRATYCPEGGFSKTVAVKRIRPDIAADPHRIEAFRAEARLAARLAHPNLVQVFDFGRFRGSYMVAMEWVDGVSLARLLRSTTRLPPAAVAYLGAELAGGLEHLHTREGEGGAPLGLVHCDVNPPNVLVSRIGEVKLGDFGVARAERTGSGTFSGKVAYAAPEQLRGEPLDGRTDLFALGLTLVEALSGRRVFASDESATSSTKDPLAGCAAGPEDLLGLLAALVQRDPDRRSASAAVVRQRCLALTGESAPYPRGRAQLAALVAAVDSPAKSDGADRRPR